MVLFLTAFMFAAGLTASPNHCQVACCRKRSSFFPTRKALNFDLYDVRAELTQTASHNEVQPHSIFAIKRHVGIAAGYDNGIVHGSLGLYLTVAQARPLEFRRDVAGDRIRTIPGDSTSEPDRR